MGDKATATTEAALPASIRRVVEVAVRAVDPDRVILYGSRARGDARQHSDYDLALVFPKDRRVKWLRFLADFDDAALTLLPVDLVDWNEAPEPLREKIHKEGIILYEQPKGTVPIFAAGRRKNGTVPLSGYRMTDNFAKALARLREFAALPIANDRDRAGVIQAFEFTFEQCW